jgi:hypothetical protein
LHTHISLGVADHAESSIARLGCNTKHNDS